MSDGTIKIDTKLDNTGIKKDLQQVEKIVDKTSKTITESMNKAEKSVDKVGKSFNSIDGKKIASQLKNVETAMDKTNTKIDSQKKKLAELKTSYEKATDTKSKNNIETEMKKAEESVVKLETRLNSLNNKKIKLDSIKDAANDLDGSFTSASMKATKALDNVEKKAEETGNKVRKSMGSISIGEGIIKVGDKISSVGNKLTMGVTMPLVGMGVAAAKIGMDFDSSMSRVKAISGAVGVEFTQLKNQALQLGSDTAFSSKQAANGMELLASAGFNTKEIMVAMPGMLDLAASSGEDLATSADIAASTLRGFGLATDQAGHVADVLAKNAGKTNAAVRDTGEAMKYIAPVAQEAGWSLESVTAAIGEMANVGIKGSSSGTALRSMFSSLVRPSDEATKAMQSMGFSAYGADKKMKSLSALIADLDKSTSKMTTQQKENTIATLFGQEAMSGILTLIKNGSSGLDELTDSYKNSDGAAKEMATTMQDNAKSAIEQMTGSLETAAIKLEEVAAPAITNIANKVQELANEFSELSPETQENIIEFALMAAAVGPVVKVVGGLTNGIGGLIKFGSKLGTMLGILGTGAEAGGVALGGLTLASGLAVGAAAALTVGIAGAITYNQLLGKSVDTSAESLTMWEKAVNSVTGGTIKSKAELQKAGLIYKDFGEGVSESFKNGIAEATKTYHDFEILLNQSNLGDKITEANQGKIKSSINKIIDEAKNTVNSRKGELQKELVAGMTVDGSGISESEQKVLDIVGKASDEKLVKISEIQSKITETWDKAIKEHGKLSSLDIEVIQNYLKQIEKIKAEASAKNEAESTFTENNFMERMNGLSAEDATKEYTEASKTIKDNYSKLKATYKTEIDDLNLEITKAQKEGRTEDVKALQQEIYDKNNLYDKAIDEEKGKRRKLLDMLYEKNPTLKGTLNEITGSMFSKKDLNTQEELKNIEKTYAEVANATKSGIKHVQDSMGGWHDIYVDVDEATGNITSAFDVNAKEGETAIGGYSEKFTQAAKKAAEKAKKDMQNLQVAFQYQSADIKKGSIKLDGDSVVNVDTGEAISKMQTIITKADETKVAIANINGEQVKIEFNKDGTIKNADDIKSAIVDHLASSPAKIGIDVDDKEAVEKFKKLEDLKDKFNKDGILIDGILIDGNQVNSIDELINKLEKLPKGKNIDLKINGEEVKTIDQALEKLGKLPKQTDTKIVIDGKQALSVSKEVQNALDRLKSKDIDINVNYNGDSFNNTQDEKNYTRALRKEMQVGSSYTGTGGGEEGLTTGNEHGWEISTGEEAIYRLGSSSSIADHMTSVNEMNQEISKQVGNSTGKVVNVLVNAMSTQKNLLAAVAQNTGQTADNSKQSNQLTEKMANNLINGMNNTSGTFSGVQKQIDNAAYEKEAANNLSIDNNEAYVKAKAEVDRIGDMTTEAKKAIGEEQLKVQKDNADKELEIAKKTAELDIIIAKQNADKKVKIADETKNKLVKISEATSNAIKNKLTEEKEAADKVHNSRLKQLETEYNTEVANIDKATKKQSESIDKKIKELDEETTATTRADERKASKDNINMLRTKMANTKSQADKDAIALQIKDAQKELNNKENSWNIDDRKAELETEKTRLAEKSEAKKASLKEEYDNQKANEEEKLKATDEYYNKLLTTDSINAQARYMMLTSSNEQLVSLLNSYAPGWQDAGQSLGDSLLNGLNSSKQSVQDAVNEMVGLRGSNSLPPPTIGKIEEGYARGTTYNQKSGLYNVDEKGFETTTSGAVAYVTKGAAIKNNMQSQAYIDESIAKQVASMKNSIIASNANMMNQVLNNISNSSSNSVTHNDNGLTFQIEKLINYSSKDTEQLMNEAEAYRQSQKKA